MIARIQWIDIAKGLGIFLVVFGHALPIEHLMSAIIWTFHMPLFFFLSGLTARSWTASSPNTFIKSLRNLVVPYLFFSAISILIWQQMHGTFLNKASWVDLAGQMSYGVSGPAGRMKYNVPLWFFTCLLSIRLLFAFITAICTSLKTTILVVIALAIFGHLYVFLNYESVLWNLDVALVGLVFYLAGYIVSKNFLNASIFTIKPFDRAQKLWFLISLLLLLSVTALNGRVDMNGRGFGNPFYFYLGAFSGIYLVVNISSRLNKVYVLSVLGRASIVVFPIHSLLEQLPNRILPTVKWYGYKLTHSIIIGSFTAATLQIILCIACYFILRNLAPQLIGLRKK